MRICDYTNISTVSKTNKGLENFSLSIERGDSIAVIGNNGSGKSLLGKLLTGALPIASGEYYHAPKTSLVSFEKIQEIIDKDNIEADITEATILNPGLTCAKLIQQESDSEEISQELLKQFSLQEKMGLAIRHLSTGEIAKALLIAALQTKPDLIILDEPFDGLDADSRHTLHEALSQLIKQGETVLLIVNRLEEIPQTIGEILIMEQREIILKSSVDLALQSEQLKRLMALHRKVPTGLPGEKRKHSPKLDSNGTLVDFDKVTVSYGGQPVLNDISWQLFPLEHWLITGPNGCGKSTLLSLISGDHPQAYNNGITLFGTKRGSGESIWDIKKELGIISTQLQRDYRVSGDVLSTVLSGYFDTIGLYDRVSPLQKREAMEWLELAEMADLAKAPFRQLSYGEQRMILILRAMVKQPSVLILDEPTLGLDIINRELVRSLISHIAQSGKTTILYVTHHPEESVQAIQKRMQFVPAPQSGYTIHCN